MRLIEVEIEPQPIDRFERIVPASELAATRQAAADAREGLAGRRLWNSAPRPSVAAWPR